MSAAAALYQATWERLFAALYDRILRRSEDAGLREMRRGLVAEARGRVLELGAGTGLNLELYPEAVSELVLLEPGSQMAKRLRARVATSARTGVEIVESGAERLPFADDSFDSAVATLVLCTVPDPAAALAELRRVLKPGAPLLFLEHVRATEPALARRQDRLERPWRFLGDGCHCNRDTAASLTAAGFELSRLERGRVPRAPAIVRPLIRGRALAA